jgi:branched-chain amino acid transport system substrate-binding protein
VGPVLRSLVVLLTLLAASSGAVEQPVPILVPSDQPPANVPAVPVPQAPPAGTAAQPPPAAIGPPAVGVLLPLSGRYQSFGESCLRGIRLALGALEGRMPQTRTVILDSRGEPAAAVDAFHKLAADPGVVAVLGPMISQDVEAVQALATTSRVPTLSFSQRAVGVGGPLLRFSLTKEDQARVLAHYAVVDLRLRRWATLHPDDSYGREIATYFRLAVEELGGHVVADVGYEPAKSDLQVEARRLQSKLGMVENQPPPIDGVFLPDSAEHLAALLSYLEFVDIRGVQLLGASGWNRPQALLSIGPSLNGAAFVDGFFVYSFRPEVRAFVDAYRDAYHTDPGTLEAYGYDAAALLLDLMRMGAVDRVRMAAELRRPFSRRGATGETVISPDGRIEKGLFVLKVEDGTVHEVDTPAATAALEGSSTVSAPARQPWAGRPEWDSRSMEDRIAH